jgi:hypothetical protein
MAKFSEWQPYSRYVQSGLVDGQFLNASFTMLAAGPPRLANLGTGFALGESLTEGSADDIVYPIGIVQNFNLSHNRQFNRVFEIGSERSFFISGRTMGQMGLSRIMYHGPSLLRVLYAYYQDLFPKTVIPSVIGADNLGAKTVANPHDVQIAPGYENLYLNLASDLFNQPVGIMVYLRDSNEDTVGSVYLESCYIPNHTMATDAQGTVIQENAAVQFERAFAVAVSSLPLVSLGESSIRAIGLE